MSSPAAERVAAAPTVASSVVTVGKRKYTVYDYADPATKRFCVVIPGGLKAVRYCCEGRAIVQRTKIAAELSATLKALGISVPKQILAVEDAPHAVAAA